MSKKQFDKEFALQEGETEVFFQVDSNWLGCITDQFLEQYPPEFRKLIQRILYGMYGVIAISSESLYVF